ncbi:MAG TPA: TonB-dependent receptor [Chitinophagaceae bacterium]|nr:TonB-dependent receptor [Chitinophagaceae bacterium]
MKKTSFTIFLAILLACRMPLSAQQLQITGLVSGSKGAPLAGASVQQSGTQNGTTTNARGRFHLTVQKAAGASLTVSYIGFETRTVPVGGKSTFSIVLRPSASGLNEVVVVGYGTQKKENLTGSVSTVSGEDLVKKPVMRASAALEGLAPGVTVTQSSGEPGSDGGTIRVRGIGTLGNSNPLVLIDGIEGTLDGVDPNDIADISILKDAASASIYGSRAANGVILVTTKSGKSEKLRVSYNSYIGWQRFTDLPKYGDGYTYMTSLNQAYLNEGRDPLYSDDYLKEYLANYKTDPDHYPNVDWQKMVFTGSGFLQHQYVGISGGSDRFRILGSLGYQDQLGEVPGYESKRYSFRVNSEMEITKNFQVRLNVSGRHSPTLSPAGGTGTYGVISEVIRQPPIFPALLSDGRFGVGWAGTNPLARVRDGGSVQDNYESFTGTIQANYQPIQGMDLEFNITPQFNDIWEKSFFKAVSTYEPGSAAPAYTFPAKSTLTESDSRSWQNTMHFLFKYNRSFASHHFHFLAGYEQIGYRNDNFNAFRDDYALPQYQELNAGSVANWQNGGTASEWALRSFFGRLDYDYKGKYLLEANLRRDGSSRFAEGNKYGIFPSFSAGWRLSEEPFLKGIGWLSNLKLRGSWGQLGNQQIGTYPFASVIDLGVNYIFGGAAAGGAAQKDMSNHDISWEATASTDIGLDAGFFNNKLSITYDYYVRNTTGILLQLPIPAIVGLNKPYQNAGSVKNTGWDLAITYRDQSEDFHYSIGFNLSDVRNEITSLKGTGPYISTYTVDMEGYSIDALYGYRAIGIFQTADQVEKSPAQFGNVAPGDIIYKDVNGDGVINADDRMVMGSQVPRLTFGLNLALSYKGFDFSMLVQGVGKKSVFLYRDAVWAFYNGGKIQDWQLDYWTPDHPDAKYPRLIAETNHNNFQNSSFWVFNSAYGRLKNLVLGYSVPQTLLQKTFIDKLRVYVSGQNMFTLDHMPQGWDPERPSGTASVYPISSTYVFGLDLTF